LLSYESVKWSPSRLKPQEYQKTHSSGHNLSHPATGRRGALKGMELWPQIIKNELSVGL